MIFYIISRKQFWKIVENSSWLSILLESKCLEWSFLIIHVVAIAVSIFSVLGFFSNDFSLLLNHLLKLPSAVLEMFQCHIELFAALL